TKVDADKVTIKVKDAQGNTFNVDVKVDIKDAVPTIEASDNLTAVSGNDSTTTGTLSYNFGADGAGSLTVNGNTYTVPTEGNPTVITGTNGTLTVNADGSYSYKANANTGGEADSFKFEITDKDGDKAEATIGITINAATGPEATTKVTVDEKGLFDSTDNSEIAEVTVTGYTVVDGGNGTYG
ncbi:Ig-like domain-containing protein, partial [Aliarcobacter cryaerophilus]|uniref:Ig-like domain-containing protein n=1 Tax=Aliarcobacter cryaerophilus TaxID=28198 RepID=UPI003DA34F71